MVKTKPDHSSALRGLLGGVKRGSVVKNPPANAGDSGSIPGSGRSLGGGHDNPLQFFLPGESHGQRSLAGYSPWGHKIIRHDLATKQVEEATGRENNISFPR